MSQLQFTTGLDLDDRYSHLYLIDTQSGEILEESQLRTTPEAFERRFGSEPPLKIAVKVGTYLPWVSRLLKRCGHEALWLTPGRSDSSTPRDARHTGSTFARTG